MTALAHSNPLDQCGEGRLERKNGFQVLHVSGSAYSRGYQQGVLLKDQIKQNIHNFIETEAFTTSKTPQIDFFKKHIPVLLEHTPEHIKEEIQGMSDGSGIDYTQLVQLNLFPELFHCSGVIASGDATKNEQLYHLRVLDYGVASGLLQEPVILVSKPDHKIANVMISYAGFIGCVSGMNERKISIGEVGGLGYPYLEGVPMAFLMKEVLENAATLKEAQSVFLSNPRTAEFFYLISDGNLNQGVGAYATSSQIHWIYPGSSYALLAPGEAPNHYKNNGLHDKFFLSDYQVECKKGRVSLLDDQDRLLANFFNQPKDCIIVTGYFTPDRFTPYYESLEKAHGDVSETTLMNALSEKTTRNSNLHNVIFCPSQLSFWVSHAKSKEEPAFTQPFAAYDLKELLEN